jgi:hypothetical protein
MGLDRTSRECCRRSASCFGMMSTGVYAAIVHQAEDSFWEACRNCTLALRSECPLTDIPEYKAKVFLTLYRPKVYRTLSRYHYTLNKINLILINGGHYWAAEQYTHLKILRFHLWASYAFIDMQDQSCVLQLIYCIRHYTVIKHCYMKTYAGVDVQIRVFLTLALIGGEMSTSRPGRFTAGKGAPGTHFIAGWLGPRIGLDDVEKRKILILLGLELRPLGLPARNQSLYRIRYIRRQLQL